MKKHIIKEGSREHVLSWDSSGRHCSDPGCEINSGKRLYMQGELPLTNQRLEGASQFNEGHYSTASP